jgi:hypothetical protein
MVWIRNRRKANLANPPERGVWGGFVNRTNNSPGGSSRSTAKIEAARENGKQGGRPGNPQIQAIIAAKEQELGRKISRQAAHQILKTLKSKH